MSYAKLVWSILTEQNNYLKGEKREDKKAFEGV